MSAVPHPDSESFSVDALNRGAAEELAKTLRVVADPTRLQILSLIVGTPDEEATVSDLAAALGFSQPTVTYHLRLLVEDGILAREQRGKFVYHSVAPERRAAIHDLLR